MANRYQNTKLKVLCFDNDSQATHSNALRRPKCLVTSYPTLDISEPSAVAVEFAHVAAGLQSRHLCRSPLPFAFVVANLQIRSLCLR